LDINIEVDGGIRKYTVPKLVKSGTDIIVPGSLVFKNSNPKKISKWLRNL
jgi:ribulose-phosphate 3-epimerase